MSISLFKPLPTETIELPNAQIVINHALKVVLMVVPEADAKDDNWLALEAHFKQRGYFLQIMGAVAPPLSTRRE
jgi:hypothetical protein